MKPKLDLIPKGHHESLICIEQGSFRRYVRRGTLTAFLREFLPIGRVAFVRPFNSENWVGDVALVATYDKGYTRGRVCIYLHSNPIPALKTHTMTLDALFRSGVSYTMQAPVKVPRVA